MKTRKLVAALSVLPVLAVGLMGEGAPASSTESSAPIFSGQLLGADGSPIVGAPVTVAALMDAEANIQRAETLAMAHTDDQGYWAVYDLESVPTGDFRTVEITGTVDEQLVVYNFPATAQTLTSLEESVQAGTRVSRKVQSASALAVDAAEEPLILRAGQGRVEPATSARSFAAAAAVEDTREATAQDVEQDAGDTGPQDGYAEVAEPAAGPCVPDSYFYKNLNQYRSAWIPLKSSRTLGKSVLEYHFNTSSQTDTEVAISGSSGQYAGGFEETQSNGTSTAVSPDWPNNTSKLVKAKWKFRKQQRWCKYGTATGYEDKPLNFFRWVSWDFSSGYTKPVADNPNFTCMSQGPVNSKVTFSETATIIWKKWFSVAGVTLSNTQTQASGTGLTVDPDAGQTPRYCGSKSSGLKYSPFVREIAS